MMLQNRSPQTVKQSTVITISDDSGSTEGHSKLCASEHNSGSDFVYINVFSEDTPAKPNEVLSSTLSEKKSVP